MSFKWPLLLPPVYVVLWGLVSQSVSQSVSQPVSQSAGQPVSHPASHPASQSVSQPVSQSARWPPMPPPVSVSSYTMWQYIFDTWIWCWMQVWLHKSVRIPTKIDMGCRLEDMLVLGLTCILAYLYRVRCGKMWNSRFLNGWGLIIQVVLVFEITVSPWWEWTEEFVYSKYPWDVLPTATDGGVVCEVCVSPICYLSTIREVERVASCWLS